jgi:hypothetical protein
MPEMTVHDITHLDALWEMASLLAQDKIELSIPEAFVFGGAVLLHDAAMSYAAYPQGIKELQETTIWKDLFELSAAKADQSFESQDLINETNLAALRALHAKQASKLSSAQWRINDQVFHFIDVDELRYFYAETIGQIAESHWWPIHKIEEMLSVKLGPLPGKTHGKVDKVKVACLLRSADAIHLDSRRAPSFTQALILPKGESADHWDFQNRLAAPYIESDEVVFTSSRPFKLEQASAWWLAFDTMNMVNSELQNTGALLKSLGLNGLAASQVRGVSSPSSLAKLIKTDQWTPINSTVRISDVPKIVETLGGAKLYGQDESVAIRELIQNASDAIAARRTLQDRAHNWGEISVRIEEKDGQHWLAIEDNGVGMSSSVLCGPMIDFGTSFWKSSLATVEFPGLLSKHKTITGKYGIGFFSVFMLGDNVRVTSRKFNHSIDQVNSLEFFDGLSSRPILYKPNSEKILPDGGTLVEVKLKNNPNEKGGLLYKGGSSLYREDKLISLDRLVAKICPALPVNVTTCTNGNTKVAVEANDWQTIPPEILISRITGSDIKGSPSLKNFRNITESCGKIVGRAMIKTSYSIQESGAVTVGGLHSCNISYIHGIFVGDEETASRNTARVKASNTALKKWATEQGKIIQRSKINDDDKSSAASIILSLGGKIGNLPIAHDHEYNWKSTSQIKNKLKSIKGESSIIFVESHELSFTDDADDFISPSDFDQHFKIRENVFSIEEQISVDNKAFQKIDSNIPESPLFDLIESLSFEMGLDSYFGFSVVGDALNQEVERYALIIFDPTEE